MQCVKVAMFTLNIVLFLCVINQLNLSCQSLGWCSLVSHPINGHKWIQVLLFLPVCITQTVKFSGLICSVYELTVSWYVTVI